MSETTLPEPCPVRANRIAALLDVPYYRRRYGLGEHVNPYHHYLHSGGHAGFDPSPLFDTAFYLDQLGPERLAEDTTPLEHYLETGAAAGLDPSALFSTRHYVAQYPEIAVAGLNPLHHFVTEGAQRGYSAVDLEKIPLATWVAGLLSRNPEDPYARHLELTLNWQERASRVAPLVDVGFYRSRHGVGLGVDVVRHYLQEGGAAGLDPSPLFDTAFYMDQLGPERLAEDTTPLEHYLERGAEAGLDPSALFSTAHYVAQYPEVAVAGLNPLHYFVTRGAQQGHSAVDPKKMPLATWVAALLSRSPEDPYGRHLKMTLKQHERALRVAPLVNVAFYRSRHDVGLGVDVVRHYLEEGAAAGFDPSPLFDTAHYLDQLGPGGLPEHTTALEHYLDTGAAAELDPSRLFATAAYLGTNPDVAAAGVNPLLHFVEHGAREGRLPVPPEVMSLEEWASALLERHPTDAHALYLVAELGFLTRTRNVAAVVDAGFYRERHGLPEDLDPIRHYLKEGGAGGLDPSPLFNTAFYLTQLDPGALSAGLTPLEHYLEEGALAGLAPSPLFDTQYYLAENPHVASANPLVHFVQSGAQHGRWTIPPERVDLDPHLDSLLPWVRTSAQAFSAVANLRLKQGRSEEAVAAVDAAGESRPAYIIWLLYVEAERLEVSGSYKAAMRLHRHILRLAPDFLTSRLALGLILRFMGRIEEAEAEVTACVAGGLEDPRLASTHGAFELERRQVLDLIEEGNAALARGQVERSRLLALQAQAARPTAPGLAELLDRVGANAPLKDRAQAQPRLLLLDTSFPSPVSSFRFGEFSAYLTTIPNSDIASCVWDLATLGNNRTFLDLALTYSEESGVDLSRIQSFHVARDFRCELMYSVFLYNAYWYLKELNHVRPERAVFTLYPGGGFGLHDAMSDRKLRAVCDDARLKRIITTQNVTYRYLVDSGLCEPERITHLFGGVVPGCFDKPGLEGALNARAEEESPALKVCFVAQRYTTLGIEKGYDVFVDIVRRFANDPRFEFHVVGGFTPDLIDLRGASNVDFHGVKPASFFPSFYARMDVIESPNVSGALLNGGSGSFDGFPTTSCVEAGLRGVAMFLTDPHKMNSRLDGEPIFEAGREFELIRRDPDEIGDLLLKYQDDRLALRGLARRGREALIREFSYERQILPRIALLQAELAMA